MNESKLSVSPEIPKRETSLPKYTIDELLEQGFVFFSPPINNYLRAINKWMQACSQAYSENDLLKEAKALSNLGCAYRLLGNLKSALEHQWSAWRLTQKLIEDYKKEPKLGSIKKKKAPSNFWVNIIQDVIHEVHSFPSYSDNSQGNNISRNSSSLNYAKFKKYKSIKSGISTPNTISTPSTAVWVMDLLSNIGNTYYTLGNFEEAVKYYNASLSIVERILKKYPLSISNPDSQNGSTQDFFIQSQTNLTTSQSTQQSITQPPSFTDNNINNFSTTTNNAYLQQQQQQLQLQQQQNQFLIKSNSSATSSNVVMTDPKFLNPTTANNGSNKNWKKMFINKSTSENSISSINNNDFSSGGFMEHSISDIKIKQNNKYTYIHRSCIIAKSRALTHLGLCYDAIYDIKKAKNYHQDALSISKNLLKYAPDMEIKNKRETVINLQMNCHNIASPVNLHYASVIANLGNNYYLQSNMNKALSHFYLALNIFDWENDKLASRKLNINIGSTWINCGKLFIQGSWWQDNELQNNHMDNRNELPKNYVKITSTEESKIYINKGISLINENVNALDKNDWISKVFFATNFASINTLINNYKEAYKYYGKLYNIKPLLNKTKVFPDVIMPLILYNLSQTSFIELFHIKKDKKKVQSLDEKRIKDLLDINKEGYDVFPNFLKLCIENISCQMDNYFSQDQKNSSRNNDTNPNINNTCNNSSTSGIDPNNPIEFKDHQNRIQQLQINNIGFDLNLNMDKASLMFNKSLLKVFQLISTTHLARIAWLIYSGAIKPSSSKESSNDWHSESNYWIRQQMILLAGCDDILVNIHDINHSLVRRGNDKLKFMNAENYNNLISTNNIWQWKIKYFDNQFLEKCFTEHCKNLLSLHGDMYFCQNIDPLGNDDFIDVASIQEKIYQEDNKKRVFEKKFGLVVNTYQEIEEIINKNVGYKGEKSPNEAKDEDEAENYIKNSSLYSHFNGKKVFVSVPDKIYTPSVVANGYLYLSILLLLDSVSKTEAYRDIMPSNKMIHILLKYSHSIYSYLCFNICPHCLSQFWSYKPEITTPLSPINEVRSHGLKNKMSIEDKLIKSSKNSPSSVVSPLAYYLNDFDHDFDDDTDANFVNFYDNIKINNKNTKNSSNLNTGFPRVNLLKTKPPQKTSRNSSLFAHKPNRDPSKILKYNSFVYDKKSGNSSNLAEDLFLKKLANIDEGKVNLDSGKNIQIDSNSIKAFNNNENNNSLNNSNYDTNNNNSKDKNLKTNDTNINQRILQDEDEPSLTINDESFNFDSYYISNINQNSTQENINLDKYYDIYSDSENGNKEDGIVKNEKKKNISILIEKQIDDHISSITNADSSEQGINETSVNILIDDKSDLSSQIDDHIESISSSLADESFEEIMKERLNIYVDESLNSNNDNNNNSNINNDTYIINKTKGKDNNSDDYNNNDDDDDEYKRNNISMIYHENSNDEIIPPMMNLDIENQFQSPPYISTSQLEKSFMIISQSLDINEDFEKEKSKTDNILKDTKESNVDNNEIKTKKDSNIDKISENLASNEKKENRVITKEELIKEQFHKKMWDVWEKYLSGDPINKNRELIRFPCIHNQAP